MGHGKHFAKRQRRRQRKLEQLRQKGHARIAELKGKHAKERKALRTTHREKGTSYSDRASEYKALRTKHKGESRQTVDSIKKEVREAFPKSTGQSSKAKEFRERLEKGTQKLGEIHATERSKVVDRHENERRDQTKGQKSERREIRAAHASERATTVADHNRYHKEDAQYIIKETRGQPIEERRKQLEHNKEVHSSRLKDALHAQRQEHAEEHAAHQDEAAGERRDLAKSQRDTRKWMDKAHKAERREAIMRLKQEIQGRSYEVYGEPIGANVLWDHRERSGRIDVARQIQGRFSRSRTHKANSAEAILKHVLRQRGWTAQYDGASLTGKQHLSLLDDVRQYGRQWLRHEAESFFDRYGVEDATEAVRARGLPQHLFPEMAQATQDATCQDREATFGFLEPNQFSQSSSRSLAARAAGALSRFFDRVGHFIREAIVAGAMALKGDDHLTNAEIYAVDRLTRKQYQYLDKFRTEVIQNPPREIADLSSQVLITGPPPMTEGQFVARLEMYGNAPWEVQNIGREIVRGQGVFQAERRVHKLSFAQHRPCHGGEQGCLEQSEMGWQPMGSLREIGDCFCMTNCDCYFEWQAPDKKIYTSPWGRHNPRGYTGIPGIAFPEDQPAIPELPGGPGPAEKRKKIKLTEPPRVDKPYPKGGKYPPARPDPTIQQIIDEAGSPHPVDYYEEI